MKYKYKYIYIIYVSFIRNTNEIFASQIWLIINYFLLEPCSGDSIYGGKFEDEITRNLKHTGAGIVSMANAGPNTNGSQFFVTLKSTPFLDGKHTIFGRIYRGMGVIQRMGLVATDSEDRPKIDVMIKKATPFCGDPPTKVIE